MAQSVSYLDRTLARDRRLARHGKLFAVHQNPTSLAGRSDRGEEYTLDHGICCTSRGP